jgi:hypothetical protein
MGSGALSPKKQRTSMNFALRQKFNLQLFLHPPTLEQLRTFVSQSITMAIDYLLHESSVGYAVSFVEGS